ncbi:MAG: hypothetical protein ACK5NN_01500 [Sphingomonadaceae bacterium]
MAREISEISLEFDPVDEEDIDESDIEVLAPEELAGIHDDAPHLVFLIPGIRTNGWWAQEARMHELLWDGREVLFVPVRGNGGSIDRLSSWHLVLRIGLQGFRDSFVDQISAIASRKNYASINVIAHSMGSALFADIAQSLVRKNPNLKFGTIAFVGSNCHRRHGLALFDCSDLFVNDAGTKDYWPYIASIVRPDSYSDVGFAGFLNAFACDRFFSHNHTTCTSLEHITTEIIPLISSSEVKPLGSPRAVAKHYNAFVYGRRAVWVLAVTLLLLPLASTIF